MQWLQGGRGGGGRGDRGSNGNGKRYNKSAKGSHHNDSVNIVVTVSLLLF